MVRQPTMKDVAALAGVSLSTVSRVVNGDPGRPDLAEKVQRAIDVLGYRRDMTASNLRRADRTSASVGLVVADVANPFFAALLRGVEDLARTRGVLTYAGSSDEDPDRERELVQGFTARRVDGLVIVPSGGDDSYLLREQQAGATLLFVDRPGVTLNVDTVLSDNAGGIATAVRHLHAHGHRRIAFLGDLQRIFTSRERLRGYREALAGLDIPVDESLIRLEVHNSQAAAEVTRELMARSDPPTALLTAQNLITIGAIHALRSRQLHHGVAHVGFDDLVLADALDPGITVVAQNPSSLGERVGTLLFERLDSVTGPPRRIIVPTTLIPRGSGEIGPRQ
ncbi:LacI family transcriptional regulator [Kibdelosporangium banguiense]|uniref:LacI family transcriptional regulator n=1 Tax=Kibdelosporangium banguiense TaxID=1365924 RepID=A0ABS4TNA7_9PSEU|nr:LacI family DNA-binding transcriptional regulator [Kibdelosporangium banguiense]MBP2325894.1 LacI family transcriptional regulator [Kibdelosporangium banguiense]